jgi:hypothetical protein
LFEVRNRAAQFLIAVLLIVSVGGHWAFLQSVAWVSMVIDFSKDAPLSVAVEKTFDGKHPCNLCKIVKHGKETEQKQDAIKEKGKTDSWLLAAVFTFESPQPFVERTSYAHPFLFPLTEAPPLPPPRAA